MHVVFLIDIGAFLLLCTALHSASRSLTGI